MQIGIMKIKNSSILATYYLPILEEDLHLYASQIAQDTATDNVGETTHQGSTLTVENNIIPI